MSKRPGPSVVKQTTATSEYSFKELFPWQSLNPNANSTQSGNNTYDKEIKLCPCERKLVANILKSKWPHHVSSNQAQKVHIKG